MGRLMSEQKMRYGTTLLAFVIIATIKLLNAAYAQPETLGKCLDFNFKSNGTKEDTINKIIAQGDCIKEQHKNRIGKWFCYVTQMVGVQPGADGALFSGRIKPQYDKFVATIKEVYDDQLKRSVCEREYGLTDNRDPLLNGCIANFNIELSPRIPVLGWSQDGYEFDGPFEKFILYGTNEFSLYKDETKSSLLTRGKCEKLN